MMISLYLISLALSMMGLVSGLIIIPIVLIYETLKIILKKWKSQQVFTYLYIRSPLLPNTHHLHILRNTTIPWYNNLNTIMVSIEEWPPYRLKKINLYLNWLVRKKRAFVILQSTQRTWYINTKGWFL